MLASHDEAWSRLAVALGLSAHEARAGYDRGATFGSLMRALGPVAGRADASTWLHGVRSRRDVLVFAYEHDDGFGVQLRTAIAAAIDPPLFLGASLSPEDSTGLADVFGAGDPKLGVAGFDGAVKIGAFDEKRMLWFLEPWSAARSPLVQSLTLWIPTGMFVTDTAVTFRVPGFIVDPTRVTELLERATWMARELGRRRRALAPTPTELVQIDAWRAFADARSLRFDPQRMRIDGEVDGIAMTIALESTPSAVQTVVRVALPRPLPFVFALRKATQLPPFGRGLAAKLATGDAAFDRDFVVEGAREALSLCASPELRAALIALGAATSELHLDGTTCACVWPRNSPTSAELEEHVASATSLAAAIPALDGNGPYR